MTLVDVAEISLIIDDNNKTSFKIDLNNFNEEILSTICNDISNQYHLPVKATEKLYQQALTEITNVRNTLYSQKILSKQFDTNEVVNRLYYEGTNKKNEQKKRNEKMLQEKINNEIKQYSFYPNMSKQTNRINSRGIIKTNKVNRHIVINDNEIRQKKQRILATLNDRIQNQVSKSNKRRESESKRVKTNENGNSNLNANDKRRNNDIYYCDLRIKDNDSNSLTTNNQLKSGCAINNKVLKRAKSIKLNNEVKLDQNNSNTFNKSSKKTNRQLTQPIYKIDCQAIFDATLNTWYDRLHNSQTTVQNKKKQMVNRFYEFQCPFEPKLSKGSMKLMKNRNESPEAKVNRLSSSKIYSALSKSIKSICNKTEANYSKNSNTHKSTLSLSSIKPNNKNSSFVSSSQKSSDPNRKRIVEERSEREINQALCDIEKIKENDLKHYYSTINKNAERYKINTIKDIYELISKDKIDFNTLSSQGIPKHIVDKVVIPTCYMITNKQLEFNFQNFYLIASEMLNKYF